NDKTIIPMQVWNAHKDELLQTTESFWGVVALSIYNSVENKKPVRKIALSDFTSFNPFKIDLNYYVKARSNYTVDEWLDILIGAIDFNPEGFDNEKQKLTIMYRLIPFVQERVNLVELAPKGTAKSYVYSKISKKAWSVTGGSMTRAKMFYDLSKKSFGLAAYYDVIAFDEIASMTFTDKDMQGALKNYLEYGTFSVGNATGTGTAGLVLLGNIAESQMNSECNMFDSLPNMFKDSALIDRFHGFIRGWDAKRMEENMKMNDWALSSEYFAEIMHALRSKTVYSDVVDNLLIIPTTADTRDTTAIKRITTALIKLLFPHWTRVELVDKEQFEKYCVIPAIQMRETIRGQMALIDTEFRGKTVPTIQIKKD
ncbi:MAG: BREX system Lon protease-like protein BrxL, partial [Clostridia bacterium]